MDSTARLIILAGVTIAVAGIALWGAAKLGLGRLPGDIVIDRGNFKLAFPIVTMLLLSVVLTIVLNIVARLWR